MRQLLLVPGLLCTPQVFRRQLYELRQLPLPIGFPAHDCAETIQTIGRRAVEEHNVTPARPSAVAGLSFGGYLGLEILRLAPRGSVSHLALISSQARPDTESTAKRRLQQMEKARAEGCISGVLKEQLPILLRKDLVPSGDLLDAFVRQGLKGGSSVDDIGSESPAEIVRRMAFETGPESFIRQQKAIMSKTDTRQVLRDAVWNDGLRLSIIAGKEDALIPPAVSRQLYSFVLGESPPEELKERVSLVLIDNAAHLVTLENPEATTKALIDWLGF
jgi:pimeloyl-ACP methyl ester carboxylesterase